MDFLHELYHGNIVFDTRRYEQDSPYMEAVHRRQEFKDRLTALLTDEAKELLENYEEAVADIYEISRYDLFRYTLEYGIKLMSAVYTQSEVSDVEGFIQRFEGGD